MTEIRWTSFNPDLFQDYQQFAEMTFGRWSYQATQSYLNWLYDENPCQKGASKGMLVGLSGQGDVVACLHRMYLTWRVKGDLVTFPTIHDIMVAQPYRTGVGALMLLKALSGNTNAFIAGAAMPFSRVYQRLGCQQVHAAWYRKVLAPGQVGLRMLAGKVGWRECPKCYFGHVRERRRGWEMTTSPETGVLDAVAKRLVGDERKVAPYWSREQLYWRLFHPIGPQHLMIYREEKTNGLDFAILSLGPRRGIGLGRVIELRVSSLHKLQSMLTACVDAVREFGGHALSIYCASEYLNGLYQQSGWKPMKRTPDSYFFHSDKKRHFESYSISGSAADFGFESIRLGAAKH